MNGPEHVAVALITGRYWTQRLRTGDRRPDDGSRPHNAGFFFQFVASLLRRAAAATTSGSHQVITQHEVSRCSSPPVGVYGSRSIMRSSHFIGGSRRRSYLATEKLMPLSSSSPPIKRPFSFLGRRISCVLILGSGSFRTGPSTSSSFRPRDFLFHLTFLQRTVRSSTQSHLRQKAMALSLFPSSTSGLFDGALRRCCCCCCLSSLFDCEADLKCASPSSALL